MSNYPLIGDIELVPVADCVNLASPVNAHDDNRRTYLATGKKPGKEILVDLDGTERALAVALGGKTSDAWQIVDGSAQEVPVNLNPATAGFTVGSNTVFTSTTGVLTTTGLNAVTDRAFQSITLQPGLYKGQITIGGVGTSSSYKTARLRVGHGTVTAGVPATIDETVVGDASHVGTTAAVAPKETLDVKFTVSAAGSITFVLDVVDNTGALASGTAYATLTNLQAVTALN